MSDLAVILTLTVGATGAVGLLGSALLYLGRRRSLRAQLMVAAVAPVLAVVAAVLVNVRFMFLSGHDSVVVLVAVFVSAVLAAAMSWWVTRRIARAVTRLDAGLTGLVTDAAGPDPRGTGDRRPDPELPQELARVLADLDAVRRALAEARTREQRTERDRRELVGFLSHDLRTPLSGLRALTEALEDGMVTDVPRSLADLRATVERMTGLVDDLSALSRVHSPTQPRPTMPVSVAEVLSDAVSEQAPVATAAAVALRLDLPEADRLAVPGRSDDLVRAAVNLVDNAVRHTVPGGRVSVRGDRDEGRVRIRVTDGCGGISATDRARVFDTGWRGSTARASDGGAGLGLAIVAGVAEAHGGRVGVDNVEGGCCFTLLLPPVGPTVLRADRLPDPHLH